MASLDNHPGMWLRDDAAAAINALEAKYGVIRINSAGRTVAQQQDLIDRFDRGEPGIYMPQRPPEESLHVKDGGTAVDVYNYTDDRAKLQEFGFEWYGNADKVHYTFKGWGGAPASAGFSQTVANEQGWLISRGYNLGSAGADGIAGPMYRAAVKLYQEHLRNYGYTGAIDGAWGPGTQDAHAKFYAVVHAAPSYPVLSLDNIASIGDVRGLQKVARLYGYKGGIDNDWGPGSKAGFANFLNRNWQGSARNWVAAKYGYSGDNYLGPNLTAALQRANAANLAAL